MHTTYEACPTQRGRLKHSAQICQDTGKEPEVQVLYDEGLANHIGPEPCGGLREETDEKSVGGHGDEVWRRESCSSRTPTLVGSVEGNIEEHATASASRALRGLRPSACGPAPYAGTGRAQGWSSRVRVVRTGKSTTRRR